MIAQLLALAAPLLPPLSHRAPDLQADLIERRFRADGAEGLDGKAARTGQSAARAAAASAAASTRWARREEGDAAEIVEGFVAGEVALGGGRGGGGAGAVGMGWGGLVGGGACGWGAGVVETGGFWRAGLLEGAIAEGISDDAGGVEVWEHFRSEGVDGFGDVSREGGALFSESDEGVGGGGVE